MVVVKFSMHCYFTSVFNVCPDVLLFVVVCLLFRLMPVPMRMLPFTPEMSSLF